MLKYLLPHTATRTVGGVVNASVSAPLSLMSGVTGRACRVSETDRWLLAGRPTRRSAEL